MIVRLTIGVFAVLILSGCSTYSLQELRNAKPQGDAFQNELSKLYMQFADSEEKDYDWRDSWYFADKGLIAAYGKDVPPEELKNWSLSKGVLSELKGARSDLIAKLTPEMIKNKPKLSARAQFYFDCWVEQQEEGWQANDIYHCKEGFLEALAELYGSGDETLKNPQKKSGKKYRPKKRRTQPKKQKNKIQLIGAGEVREEVKEKDQKPIKKEEKKPIAKAAKSNAPTVTSFVVFFERGNARLTEAGGAVLHKIKKIIDGKKDYDVIVTAKSPANGREKRLSLERTDFIKKQLMEIGVDLSVIKSDSARRGENEKINRRIEIFLND